jgi:hypothetical protein
MMKKIKLLLSVFIAICTLNSCTDEVDPQGTNYVTFEDDSYSFGVDLGSENTNAIKIYAANITATDRTIGVAVIAASTTLDAAAYTVPTTVTIPANSNVGTISVSVSDLGISADGETLSIGLEAAAGLYVGGNITVNVRQVCPYNEVNINIAFDSYPEEVYWKLENSSGTIVAENVLGSYDGMSGSVDVVLCLTDDTYTFSVTDAYSDGGGAISITSGTTVLFSTNGVYGAGVSGSFTF